MKKLLCAIGFHQWKIVGYNSVLNPMPVEMCERCGIGRQFHMYGAEFRWTKDEMNQMLSQQQNHERMA